MAQSKVDHLKVELGFQTVLEGLGIRWRGDDHMSDTPRRAAKAWIEELTRGLHEPMPIPRSFPFEGDTGMVVLRSIPVRSLCAHHLLPFYGSAVVGYIGNSRVLGVSKLSRIVDYYSRQPQVQERLTHQVADAIHAVVGDSHTDSGVGVVIRANHMCMKLRGVKHDGDMVTSSLRGIFQEADVKAEFFKIAYDITGET